MSAMSAVQDWLHDSVESLIGIGTAVRRDEDDSVHSARTMTRRLRAVLGLVPGEEARTARAELKRYGQVLGAARDFEVRAELAAKLLEDVADADEDDAAHDRLLTGLRRGYERAHADVVAYLDGPDYRRLTEQLERLVTRSDQLNDVDELDIQHEARKHARALRYLAEALGDEETAKAGATLQDAFGDRRDYALLARSLDGESDESLARVRAAALKRAGD